MRQSVVDGSADGTGEDGGLLPGVGMGMALRSADRAFYRQLRDRLALDGVGFSEFQHLRHLWQQDGMSQVELAARIGIGKASSTKVLDGLDRRGLIRRDRDASDRRRQNVHLTEAGRALEEGLWSRAHAVNRMARQGLSRAEVETLFSLLHRVTANLTPDGAAPVEDDE